jgi:hypothetical protein
MLDGRGFEQRRWPLTSAADLQSVGRLGFFVAWTRASCWSGPFTERSPERPATNFVRRYGLSRFFFVVGLEIKRELLVGAQSAKVELGLLGYV